MLKKYLNFHSHIWPKEQLNSIENVVSHISSKSPKPLFGAFGQTEKTGFKVFGSFQPGLPRKVPQSL